jgi:hypothetical protein
MHTFKGRRQGFVSLSKLEKTPLHPTRRIAYYIDVRDVDLLYTELKPKFDTLPKGDVGGPINQKWGQRELLVLAPDGNLIAFGQRIDA